MSYIFKSCTGAEREIDERGRTIRLTAPNGFTESAEYNSNGSKKYYSVSGAYEETYEEVDDIHTTTSSYGVETFGEITEDLEGNPSVYMESTDGFRMWYNMDAQLVAIYCNDTMSIFEYDEDGYIIDVKQAA